MMRLTPKLGRERAKQNASPDTPHLESLASSNVTLGALLIGIDLLADQLNELLGCQDTQI
jgi:hypothetical protein